MNTLISKILYDRLTEYVQHDMGKAKELFKGLLEIETNKFYHQAVKEIELWTNN
jgi:hypothetical protein